MTEVEQESYVAKHVAFSVAQQLEVQFTLKLESSEAPKTLPGAWPQKIERTEADNDEQNLPLQYSRAVGKNLMPLSETFKVCSYSSFLVSFFIFMCLFRYCYVVRFQEFCLLLWFIEYFTSS